RVAAPAVPGDGRGRNSSRRADAGEKNLPQPSPHIRETRARARCTNHLALAPPRPLIAKGDDRHLRTLGARRAKASGSQDGGRLPGLTAVLNPYSRDAQPTVSGKVFPGLAGGSGRA